MTVELLAVHFFLRTRTKKQALHDIKHIASSTFVFLKSEIREKNLSRKQKSCVKLDKQQDKHAVALFEARDSIAWLINESGNKI